MCWMDKWRQTYIFHGYYFCFCNMLYCHISSVSPSDSSIDGAETAFSQNFSNSIQLFKLSFRRSLDGIDVILIHLCIIITNQSVFILHGLLGHLNIITRAHGGDMRLSVIFCFPEHFGTTCCKMISVMSRCNAVSRPTDRNAVTEPCISRVPVYAAAVYNCTPAYSTSA